MDISSQVIEAINAWLVNLAAHLLKPALAAASQLLFQTPAYDSIPEVEKSWAIVRNTADGLFVLALIAAAVLVMASGSIDSRYTAKLLLPRVVLAAVAANLSLVACGALIRLDNALVTGLLGPDPATGTFAQLAAVVERPQVGDQVAGSLVALAAAVLAILLVAIYIGRDLVLLVAIVLAPLALATYALPQTDEIAHIWWRAFSALLFVQVIQAVLIELGLQLLTHTAWLGSPVSDLTSGLVLVTLLYLLFKLPFAAYRWAFRHELRQSPLVQKVMVAARAVAAAA